MSTTRARFVEKCMDIIQAKPEYKIGASDTRQCDCIGMIKYGLRQNGVKLSTTGTNWTFRNQVDNIRRITSASVLRIGDVVFKVRKPGDSGYDLKAKYKPGGSAYNGDLNDYSHIGVVKTVSPLRIIHMTGPTAKTDSTIGKWAYAADLKKEYIDDSVSEPVTTPEPVVTPEPEKPPEENNNTPVIMTATVCADNGKPVKIRQKPSSRCRVYDELPVGTVVTVTSYKEDWCKVIYRYRNGWYIMTKFLSFG